MKVCIISRFFPEDYIGGGENVIYNIWKNAIANNYEVSLISGWTKDPRLLPENSYKIDLRSNNRFIRYMRVYRAVKKYVKEINPDIIHTNTLEIPELGIPTIVIVQHISHFLDIEKNTFFVKLMLRLQKFLVKKRLEKAKIIVTGSNATKEDLIRLGINPEKIKVIHYGIDFEKFDRIKNEEINRIKRKRNDKKKEFVIVLPSRISPEKGQDIAINAIKILPAEIKNKIKLILVGFVSDKSYLLELEKDCKGENIEIMTNIPNIEEYYFKADIIIFPTLLKEGFGLVAAEALACSKPLIASDMPSIKEIVNDYGILIEPNNTEKLKDAMVEVYNNRKKYDVLAKKGYLHVRKNFSWENAFREYNELYNKIDTENKNRIRGKDEY